MAKSVSRRSTGRAATIVNEVAGNRIELLETGKSRLDRILELIRGAQSSIRVLFYMFNEDAVAESVRDALAEAAARGVAVHLLIDGFGSDAPSKFFEPLEQSGGDFCVFHPRFSRAYVLRNHQKMIIVDERIVLIGGANIDAGYLTDRGPDHWRDLMIAIEGSEASPATGYFDALYRWARRKKPSLRSLRRIVSEHSEWRGALQWKFSGPLSIRNSWWRSIGSDMKNGQDLEMIFAYFAPPGAMLRRIGGVGSRGSARIITAARSDNSATIAAARHSYSRLLRRHVRMYEYRPAKLHTKLVIIDDVVHIGSSNFDFRSLYINLEVMLRIKDAAFAKRMRGYFEHELANSRWISPALHKKRANPWRRLKWAISHFLVTTMDYTIARRLNFSSER